MRLRLLIVFLLAGVCAGCGTTKWTDTSRTATEQLLISNSMDRAVSRLDLRAVAGKKVFLDETPIKSLTDNAYLTSTLKQHILASGAILKEKREEADYVIEVRAGAVGTDRHDLLFGVPALTIPTTPLYPSMPSQIPEVPLVKRTDQRGVASISLFVYNRQTGRPLYQSGAIPEESRAKAVWVFGAGPFQRGTIYRGTKLAGILNVPMVDVGREAEGRHTSISVADEASFVEPKEKEAPKSAVVQDGKAPAAKEGSPPAAGQNQAAAPVAGAPAVVAAAHTASPASSPGTALPSAASTATPAAPSTSSGSSGPALAPPATSAASTPPLPPATSSLPAPSGQSTPPAAPGGSSNQPAATAPASSSAGPRLDSASTAPFFPPSRYTDPSSLSWPLPLAPLNETGEGVAGRSVWQLWR